MSIGLRELQPQELTAALTSDLAPRLDKLLNERTDGHCMRVSDLDKNLMIQLCERVRQLQPTAQVYVLTNESGKGVPAKLAVTSTKLVELRNPHPDGTQRPPLLIFIPNELRTAAEDSFGIATFEAVELGDVYQRLAVELLQALPRGVRGELNEGLRGLCSADSQWSGLDDLQVLRFLLTAKYNGNDPEAFGGALFELQLVPDFELFSDPAQVPARLRRNLKAVKELTESELSERGRVLSLGLSSKLFQQQLAALLVAIGLEEPRRWTRQIVLNRENWPLAFNRWPFDDNDAPDSICIQSVDVDLPPFDTSKQKPELQEALAHLEGQPVLPLGPGGLRKFSSKFAVEPHPSKIQGLHEFVCQVISAELGPVGLVKSKQVWKGKSPTATVSFTALNRIDFQEGWHFVRVLARTEAGDLIPLVNEQGEPLPWAADADTDVRQLNESELFYVIPNDDIEVEPPQRAVPKDESLLHARFGLQFTALMDERDCTAIAATEVSWSDRSKARSVGTELIELKFGREGTRHVPVSTVLKSLEQRILADASGPMRWRLTVRGDDLESTTGEAGSWPQSEACSHFLACREALFECIRASEISMISQGFDYVENAGVVEAYAEAYQTALQMTLSNASSSNRLAKRNALAELRSLLGIDTARVVWLDGARNEATLVAPTHPLRALWFVQWARLGTHWLRRLKDEKHENAGLAKTALLEKLSPINFPPLLPDDTGSLLAAIDNLNPFWTVYAPAWETDPQGVFNSVASALGLDASSSGTVRNHLAEFEHRVKRYLLQHPYVSRLSINVFNPGNASLVAGLLLRLQKQPAFSDLLYDIRVFVPDPERPGVAEAVLGLLSSTSNRPVAEETDAFQQSTGLHLAPKLDLAILPIDEFSASPERYASHISLLMDLFPAQNVGVQVDDGEQQVAPVHGLVQAFKVNYCEDDSSATWTRQPEHGVPSPIGTEVGDDLARLAELVSKATATVATGRVGQGLKPVVSLTLQGAGLALLHQVHRYTDWVFTLDRNLGIEFFDHGGRANRPDYLIDHAPIGGVNSNHQLVVTSRSLEELEALIKPVLQSYKLDATPAHTVAILDQLRSLSGQLALKLLSASTQRAEALGLALSRLYLAHQGVFENQIVIPLDAHLELYDDIRSGADTLNDEISYKRTDLALFDLDLSRRRITCRLVEVKCYSNVGDLSAYQKLKLHIADQLAQSETVISRHFDPALTVPDRLDRPLKSQEFRELLKFYLERAHRYELMLDEPYQEAQYLLASLEKGYRLDFTRSALIFDFEKSGTEPAENEAGVEYHRIGDDLIRQLVTAAGDLASTPQDREEVGTTIAAESLRGRRQVMIYRDLAPSVPTLDEAAFIGEVRDRTLPESALLLDDSPDSKLTTPFEQSAEVQDNEVDKAAEELERPSESEVADESGLGDSAESMPSPREQAADSGANTEQGHKAPQTQAGIPEYDVMLGVNGDSLQFGVLGEVSGRRVALDLNHTHTVSLFGVQGGGKSYTLGSIAEMATVPVQGINALPFPLATIIFHYSPTMDYQPEFTSMVDPNSDEEQLKVLRERYGAEPAALEDVLLLVPEDKLDARRVEYPRIQVEPLKFSAAELQTKHWQFLMGAVGNQATYIRQLKRTIKRIRDDLSLQRLRDELANSNLPDHLRELAEMRLDMASDYIDDSANIKDLIRPGRLVIVDLRDEFIEKDEALGLFVVLLELFADAKDHDKNFNKLVVFDEAHKYIDSPDLVAGLVSTVREMRHKGTSILIASQDPPSVPVSLIELSSQIILHKFNSPAWLKHIQKANAALGGLSPERMAHLRPGEAYIWSSKASDPVFTREAVKVSLRPRFTAHGGDTKTAVS